MAGEDAELPCARCGRPVRVNRDSYQLFERMHYVCFHYEFEHDGDPDEPCDAGGCPRPCSPPRGDRAPPGAAPRQPVRDADPGGHGVPAPPGADDCYRPRYLNIKRLNYRWTTRHSSARLAGNLIT